MEDSPAAEAKLRPGDRLLGIAGRSAGTVSLGEVLERLKGDGDTLRFRALI